MRGPPAMVVWLLRHPMAAVTAVLTVIVLASLCLVLLLPDGAPQRSAAATGPRVAPYTLPVAKQHPPAAPVNVAHRALHALGRACKRPPGQRQLGAVTTPLRRIEAFARRYPSAGFTIDDEPGTTLALLIVVRAELASCAPSLVARAEALIPPRYRGD